MRIVTLYCQFDRLSIISYNDIWYLKKMEKVYRWVDAPALSVTLTTRGVGHYEKYESFMREPDYERMINVLS